MNHVAFRSSHSPSVVMRSIIPLVVATTLALGATACSSSESDTSETSTTTQATQSTTTSQPTTSTTAATTTTETTTVNPTETELADAISAFWAMYDELGASKEPFDPGIRSRMEEHATGDQLATLFNYFQSNARAGYYIQGGVESSLTVVSATPIEAQVRDCYDDFSGLYRIENDERVDVDDPARHQVVYTLVNESGAWKVASILDEGSGCIVSS
ncbi:MAG: hypothetical protein WBD41_18420 [Rhodococcus sp. (in: high G+C Gram-positive bacteria)]